MFVYVAKKRNAWVGSIFQYNADAVEWWAKVPDHAREVLEGLEQPGLEYPFLIIEWFPEDELGKPGRASSNGFEFVSLDEGEDALKQIVRQDSTGIDKGDFTYCNVYLIAEDYTGHPDKPGADYMGALEHWHIDNDYLDLFAKGHWPWRCDA